MLAGGTPRDLARAADLLAVFGIVTECGGPGAGSARKLVLINGIVAGVSVVGEALALAERPVLAAAERVLASAPDQDADLGAAVLALNGKR